MRLVVLVVAFVLANAWPPNGTVWAVGRQSFLHESVMRAHIVTFDVDWQPTSLAVIGTLYGVYTYYCTGGLVDRVFYGVVAHNGDSPTIIVTGVNVDTRRLVINTTVPLPNFPRGACSTFPSDILVTNTTPAIVMVYQCFTPHATPQQYWVRVYSLPLATLTPVLLGDTFRMNYTLPGNPPPGARFPTFISTTPHFLDGGPALLVIAIAYTGNDNGNADPTRAVTWSAAFDLSNVTQPVAPLVHIIADTLPPCWPTWGGGGPPALPHSVIGTASLNVNTTQICAVDVSQPPPPHGQRLPHVLVNVTKRQPWIGTFQVRYVGTTEPSVILYTTDVSLVGPGMVRYLWVVDFRTHEVLLHTPIGDFLTGADFLVLRMSLVYG